ncbi:hypothetical protein [Dyadobacter sp. NIV53]|uniref:hypothetical protein n=1 Tax=Dyadobacter sp. NIV53 TaxID=2861765 RepID=UPI001C872940|nr:hypothetical protein [Dyadobacter sp. NIV53]
MKQGFYTFANFFLGLSILMAVFNSILYYFLDNSFFLLNAFKNWHLAENVVGVAVILFMLRYYHFKKYYVSL